MTNVLREETSIELIFYRGTVGQDGPGAKCTDPSEVNFYGSIRENLQLVGKIDF